MKTEPIHIRPGLSLYKQPITSKGGSPYWYARVRMKIEGRNLHAKSTSTTDEAAARRFAEAFYTECFVAAKFGHLGGPCSSTDHRRRFDVVADEWLTQKELLAGKDKRRLRGWDDARKLIVAPNGLGAFFKRKDIANITTDDVRQYLCFAAAGSKQGQLATTTQRNHLSTLNAILKFGAERRLIEAAPPMPRLRLKDNPRPYFNDIEIRELCLCAGFLKRGAAAKGDERLAAQWTEVEDFVTFMLATFLRAGEWKELRQKHCYPVDGANPYLEVSVPNGKTHPRRVVSMPEALPVWGRIIARNGDDPERLLFLQQYQNRETAKEHMDDLFKALLREADLEFDSFGNKRTLYSLRHTALMNRLIHGQNIDIFMLAKNAGTSVDQLERFYLSHADPAMKVANLHSSKPQPVFQFIEPPEDPRGSIQIEASLSEPHSDPTVS
ncbi:tyrosine-type recombinase/integrase [Sphingomonas alba]|uniref:Site-specific integrase n=1 Tax=Sphingomonas alba TaxID=2908208 RepID=A0ABT0RNN5_9SPHN|nr:tyrosine-type recombinase/integrase [Sphingomonas alba]MCL6684082.1 site-specific integrase [Sphingomonas alba]